MGHYKISLAYAQWLGCLLMNILRPMIWIFENLEVHAFTQMALLFRLRCEIFLALSYSLLQVVIA